MSKPDFPFWARTNQAGQITVPPQAKIDRGHNAGQPSAAGFQNWHMNRTGLWVKGLQHGFADIVVGSAAQVLANEADVDITELAATPPVAGDMVSFLGGQTHTQTANIDITADDVKLVFETDAVLAADTFTLTLSGDRIRVIDSQFSGYGANDVILSGNFGLLMGTRLDHDSIDLSGELWSIIMEGMQHRSRQFVEVLSDAAHTLTRKDIGKKLLITPTTTRIQTLPTTSIQAGDVIEFLNLATAQKITVEASAGADIASFQDGYIKLMALQDTPTLATHWIVLDVFGGANPVMRVKKSADQAIGTSSEVQVTWDTEDFDSNGNFASDAFTPTVLGKYLFIVSIFVYNATEGDRHTARLKQGSTIIAEHTGNTSDAPGPETQPVINVIFDVDSLMDDYTTYIDTDDADSSYTVGGGFGNAFSYFSATRIGN